jgi:hypothetical protein
MFKRTTGFYPSEYRKNLKKTQEGGDLAIKKFNRPV